MNRTKIEWCQSPDGTPGYTWNPLTGCLNHVEGKCKAGDFPCYAHRLANGRLKSRMLANSNLPCHDEPDHEAHHADPFYPRLWRSRVTEILRGRQHQSWSRPPGRGIFVSSMGDLFGKGVPKLWTHQVLDTIRIMDKGNQHWYPTNDRFYLLTKQPQNLPYWSPFPDNCWVGVSVTNTEQYNEARAALRNIKAGVKYLSFEPLLERVSMSHVGLLNAGINWVIIGAQTTPTVMPEYTWVREIVDAADAAKIPVFLKDSLTNILGKVSGRWLRQEMPRSKEPIDTAAPAGVE